ncbi:MAG TPA: excinuclease ABC subunit UvrC, partial [Planctomycetota bacterium]|nr:excinuclease ABC subunit UvrC [Planctomycetota bacterium]
MAEGRRGKNKKSAGTEPPPRDRRADLLDVPPAEPGAALEAPTRDGPSERVAKILDRLPTEPGVYLMKDKKGRVLYVGKAASLRARVRSYFNRGGDGRAFIALLDRLLGDIETVVTNNEKEALLLENNLIKQHQPRFNVKLVDDKNFLVLRLDLKQRYPRLEVRRRLGHDGARYFGPYHSASSCRATLAVVNRHFKLRTCTDHVMRSRRRPCLQYQIKRCDAPCVFPVAPEEYGKQVQDVALFLEGKDRELLERLQARMKQAALATEFEVAGALRDQIQALQKTLEDQRVVSAELRDQDVIGLYREGPAVEIIVLSIRNGKLLGRRNFSFGGQEFPSDEVVSSFVSLYYDLGSYLPDEVLLPVAIEDAAIKGEWLSDKRGRKVEVLTPQRGTRRRLVELADKNAASSFVTRRNKAEDTELALSRLQQRLSLKKSPHRIECFDISHLQGALTVASMVVFLDGEAAKSEYRTFKIKSASNDDFASMYEVLSRRFRRARILDDETRASNARRGAAREASPSEGGREGPPPTGRAGWVVPDLLVIDGGKGQLGTALAALRDAQIDTGAQGIDVVGLAKEREDAEGSKQPDRVYLARAKDPIKLKSNSAELYLLARIRDEAHRFAIAFHRKLRRGRTLRSTLDDVPGIGDRRKRELLKHFGSLKKIHEASLEALAQAPGMTMKAAEAVQRHLAGIAPPGTAAVDVYA